MVAPKPSSRRRAALTFVACAAIALSACSASDSSPASSSSLGGAGGSSGRSASGGLTGSGGLVAMGGLGSAGKAGGAGTAGMSTAPPLVPNARCAEVPVAEGDPLIDDLEDGDNVIAETDGRRGYWFTFHDRSEDAEQYPADAFEPTPGGRAGSSYAAHTTGSGYSLWGAGMGLSLNAQDGLTCGYDASACRGISFWAKSDSTAPDTVRLRIATEETTPQRTGGSCGAPYETWCHNDFGVAVTLSADWKQYRFDWDELSQEGGWGLMTGFNPTRIVLLQWQVSSNVSFDFWVDEIAFTGCDAGGGMAGAPGTE